MRRSSLQLRWCIRARGRPAPVREHSEPFVLRRTVKKRGGSTCWTAIVGGKSAIRSGRVNVRFAVRRSRWTPSKSETLFLSRGTVSRATTHFWGRKTSVLFLEDARDARLFFFLPFFLAAVESKKGKLARLNVRKSIRSWVGRRRSEIRTNAFVFALVDQADCVRPPICTDVLSTLYLTFKTFVFYVFTDRVCSFVGNPAGRKTTTEFVRGVVSRARPQERPCCSLLRSHRPRRRPPSRRHRPK